MADNSYKVGGCSKATFDRLVSEHKLITRKVYYVADRNTTESGLLNTDETGALYIATSDRTYMSIGQSEALNILVIGNSFSLDAFQYVPAIAKAVGINVNVVQIYHGGDSTWQISTYKDIIDSNTAFFAIYQYDNTATKWKSVKTGSNGKYSDVKALYGHYDLVVINQYSVANVDASLTVQPSQDLVNYLEQKQEFSGAKFAFFASPVYANGYANLSNLGYASSQEMWLAQTEVNKKVALSCFDFFIPANTAIENARTYATFDALGTFGHLSYDGQHLQEGLPCFISAVTALQTIANEFLGNAFAIGNDVRPTDAWVTEQAVKGKHGNCVGISDTNCSLAYHCVRAAIEQPYQITTINESGAVAEDYYVNTNRVQTINALKTFLSGLRIGGSSMVELSNAIEVTTKDFNVNGESVKTRRSYNNNTKARILGISVYGSGYNANGESNYPRLLARKEEDGTVTETTSVAMHDDNIAFALSRTTILALINANSNADQDWATKQLPTKNAVALYVAGQLSNVVHKTGDETITGVKSFTDSMKFGSGSSTVDLVKNGTIMELQKSAMFRLQRVYANSERHIALHVWGTTDDGSTIPRLVAQKVDLSGDNPVTTETTSVALRDDKISFALQRTTEWGFVNATSNSDENWNTKEIPTKAAVAAKITEEIASANETGVVNSSHTQGGVQDITLAQTAHYKTTYVRVTCAKQINIQVLTPNAEAGDIIIVDSSRCEAGGVCFRPVKYSSNADYHSFDVCENTIVTYGSTHFQTLIKWYYNGTSWQRLEKTICEPLINTSD